MSEATLRARGQWLHAPGGDVLRHLLAVQAQDLRTPERALAVRGGALDDGMRITWLMRQTLHLVSADDLEWLHPLFAPRMEATNVRRLKQLGVTDPDAYVARIVARVPATRAELKAELGVEGQGFVHLLARAAMQGHVVQDVERRFIPWAPREIDRDAALDELARRYGACHHGASRDDLAYWSGLPKRDCREPGPCLVEDGPVPRVDLPAYDELLLGWKDRSPTVPAALAKQVHPGGGIIRAVTLVDGVAVKGA
ncbi:DNA glycosylase AlkZ-like family protein [Solirubrobacter soli]|uniref:DNA glycosylase AlkZ-like family protein n=1 Tax=Solirubrobacter soli TaxID=363832 RepID=UPI0003FEF296|nr:crosslink repair DNA glycosylase YcaQ family protein [Solirubrobacter soli]